jgi:hypothetical protein
MIAVSVRVCDDELRRARAIVSAGPSRQRGAHRSSNVGSLRSRVEQQNLVAAEDQVEERLFIVCASGLAEDVEVRVVLVKAEVGGGGADGAVGLRPGGGQDAAFEIRAVGLRDLGGQDAAGDTSDGDAMQKAFYWHSPSTACTACALERAARASSSDASANSG